MCSSLLSSPDIWDALDELWVSENLGSDSHGSLAGELVDNNLVFGLHFVVLFANWVDLLNKFVVSLVLGLLLLLDFLVVLLFVLVDMCLGLFEESLEVFLMSLNFLYCFNHFVSLVICF